MANKNFVPEWILRTTQESTVAQLLPTYIETISDYQWREPLKPGIDHDTALKFQSAHYSQVVNIVPSLSDARSLTMFHRHSSIQVRRAVAGNSNLGRPERDYLTKWAISKEDKATMEALSAGMTLEELDVIDAEHPEFNTQITTAWCTAVAKAPNGHKRVTEEILTYAANQRNSARMQQLVKHVIEGRVENLTISEVIAAANVGSRQLIAATAFAQAPRLTRELADVAIAHLNGPQPIGVNLANQRYNDRLGVVCVATTYDEEAALYLARHGHSKLLFNVLNWMTAYGATPSDALVDALLTTCEQARTKGTQVDANSAGAIAGTCTKREFATPEQRNRAALIVSDLARVSSMFGFEAGPGSTWVTDVGDAACRDVLTPDVLAQVMCAMSAGNAQTFMKWVTYGIESAKPSVKVLGAVLEEISATAWGEQNLQLAVESNQIGWDRIEGFPEILDLVVDHIGPKALHLETYVVKNRIVARLDVACEGRPETAQAIASLMEDWDGSLAKLIETGLILSGHSPDEVGVERRMVQASLF